MASLRPPVHHPDRDWSLDPDFVSVPVLPKIVLTSSIGAALSVLIIFSSYDSLFLAAGVAAPENLWLASIMTADIIITCCILFGLIRSKTGWSHTDRVSVKSCDGSTHS